VSDGGIVVGSAVFDPNGSQGFQWEAGTMVQIHQPTALDVNELGQVITKFGTLYHGGATTLVAPGLSNETRAINELGQVVGDASINSLHRSYLWDDGDITVIDPLPGGTWSTAHDINDRGRVVGWSTNRAGDGRAYLYSDGELVDLGTLGGTRSEAYAINNFDYVAGYSRDPSGEDRAMLFDGYTMVDLGEHATALSSRAYDVNDRGQAVGQSYYATLWENGQVYDLNQLIPAGTGWTLWSANGINSHGWIVGHGVRGGQTRAFLLKPVEAYAAGPGYSLASGDVVSESNDPVELRVPFTDADGVDVFTLDGDDLRVTGPKGFVGSASFIGLEGDTGNGSPRTAVYQLTAPGGGWNSDDNGVYTVWLNDGEVADENGQSAKGGSFGRFMVGIADTVAPAAVATAEDVIQYGRAYVDIAVTYSDNVAVDVSDIGGGDLRVTGPGGFDAVANFVSFDVNRDGTPRQAMYRLPAPGGTWSSLDNGTYTVSMIADAVSDTSGNPIAAGALDTFEVDLAVTAQYILVTLAGTTDGKPTDINNLGEVSMNLDAAGDDRMYLWTGDTLVDIGNLGQAEGNANGMNDLGQIVGWSAPLSSGNNEAFIYTGGTVTSLGKLNGYAYSEAIAINNSGQAVGSAYSSGGGNKRAVLFQNGQVIDLGNFGGFDAFANDINAQGQAVGQAQNAANARFAFLWEDLNDNGLHDAGELANLGTLVGGGTSEATAINDGGVLVGRARLGSNFQPIIWDSVNGMRQLPLLAGTVRGQTIDINNNGDILAVHFDSSNLATYVIYRNGVPAAINALLEGPGISQVYAINDNGQILAKSSNQVVVLHRTDVDLTAPIATAQAADINAGGGATHTFTVTYSDETAVDDSTIDDADVLVTRPGGFSQLAELVSVAVNPSGARVATYRIDATGGVWDTPDNGTYTITIQANAVMDTAGNSVAPSVLATFTVSADITRPAAALPAGPPANGGPSHAFAVHYSDDLLLDLSTINAADVVVIAPDGSHLQPVLVGVNQAQNALTATAVYRVAAPGGVWDASDDGVYTVLMNGGQVADVKGNTVEPGTLGTFDVDATLVLQYEIIEVSPLPDGNGTNVWDINDLGQVAGVSYGGSWYTQRGFIFDPLAESPHIELGQRVVRATGINNHGQVVGQYEFSEGNTNVRRGFFYENGVFTPIGPEGTMMLDINDSGMAIAKTISWFEGQAGRSTNQGAQDSAFAINNRNQIAVQGFNTYGSYVFQLPVGIGNNTRLGTLHGINVKPLGINDVTQVVGSGANGLGDTQAWLWEKGVFTELGTLPSRPDAEAQGVNLLGTIVGTAYSSGGGFTNAALVWHNGVLHDLNDLVVDADGWDLRQAYAINSSGWIVGDGLRNGVWLGFIAVPDLVKPFVESVDLPAITEAAEAQTLTVTFNDNLAISTASLSDGDLMIVGPNGFEATAQFMGTGAPALAGGQTLGRLALSSTSSGPVTAQYHIVPDDSGWTADNNGTYYVFLQSNQVSDTSGNRVAPQLVGSFNVDIAPDSLPPAVTAIAVASSDWSAAFLDHLGAAGMGEGGYELPVLTLPPAAPAVPWVGIDRVSITFTEAVNIDAGLLQLVGIASPTIAVASVTYDAATHTATFTLDAPLGGDRWMIDLSGALTDAAGNALGEPFEYRFDVLPGDVNFSGSVLGDDVILVRNAQFRTAGGAGYDAMLDLNGSGTILGDDVVLVRNRQFTNLPEEPIMMLEQAEVLAAASSALMTHELTPTASSVPSAALDEKLLGAVAAELQRMQSAQARPPHLPVSSRRSPLVSDNDDRGKRLRDGLGALAHRKDLGDVHAFRLR